jgi:hypothetical protein
LKRFVVHSLTLNHGVFLHPGISSRVSHLQLRVTHSILERDHTQLQQKHQDVCNLYEAQLEKCKILEQNISSLYTTVKLELKRKDDEIIRLRHIVDTERDVHVVKERAMQQFLQELKTLSIQLKHALDSSTPSDLSQPIDSISSNNNRVYIRNILHDLSKKLELLE